MKVAVSILSLDFSKGFEEVELIDKDLDYYHLDVMDGHFVPNISFGPSIIKNFRAHTKVTFDTHLMISHPLKYINEFVKAGSDMISFHYECDDDPIEVINKIKECNVKAGIATKPKTSVEEIKKLLPLIDYVLVMSVEPGFGGQSFMPSANDKIKELVKLREELNLNYLISVDGGINNNTGKEVVEAGIDFAVVGSYLLDKVDPVKKLQILKNI